jgi:hypothetical protein
MITASALKWKCIYSLCVQILREMTCKIKLNFKGLGICLSVHSFSDVAFNDLHAQTHTHDYKCEFKCVTQDIKY